LGNSAAVAAAAAAGWAAPKATVACLADTAALQVVGRVAAAGGPAGKTEAAQTAAENNRCS